MANTFFTNENSRSEGTSTATSHCRDASLRLCELSATETPIIIKIHNHKELITAKHLVHIVLTNCPPTSQLLHTGCSAHANCTREFINRLSPTATQRTQSHAQAMALPQERLVT